MAFTPETRLYLAKVPLKNDGASTITWWTETDQLNYFMSNSDKNYSGITYQRKDNVVRFNENADKLMNYNYCFYRNANYGNKWFYAFIVKCEYVNAKMTQLHLVTDIWQTWWFNIKIGECYVAREHVNIDDKYLHTCTEPIGASEYVFTPLAESLPDKLTKSPYTLIATTAKYAGDERSDGGLYNGTYYPFDFYVGNSESSTQLLMKKFRAKFDDAILYACSAPQFVFDKLEFAGSNVTTKEYATWDEISVNINYNDIDGYIPKNKKCFCYPYNYLTLDNNCGGKTDLLFEDMQRVSTQSFFIYGDIVDGNTYSIIPKNYKGVLNNWLYGINGPTYPSCVTNSDQSNYYKQQELQARNKFELEKSQHYANTAVSASSMAMTGAAVGSFVPGLGTAVGAIGGLAVAGIKEALGSYQRHQDFEMQMNNLEMARQQQSYNVHGLAGCSSIQALSGYISPHILRKHIRREQVEQLDNFFTAYGYQVNKTKKPNIRGRKNHNFVQCGMVNVSGEMPQEDMNNIIAGLKNGITFWHQSGTMYNYSADNTPS